MWDPPRPGLEPVSPALAGGFSTTAPPGKPRGHDFLNWLLVTLANSCFSNVEGAFLWSNLWNEVKEPVLFSHGLNVTAEVKMRRAELLLFFYVKGASHGILCSANVTFLLFSRNKPTNWEKPSLLIFQNNLSFTMLPSSNRLGLSYLTGTGLHKLMPGTWKPTYRHFKFSVANKHL